MPAILQIRRSSSNTVVTGLRVGELAYSWAPGANKLYIGTGTSNSSNLASNISIIGGKYFTDMLDHTPGILTGNSAIIVDQNSRIDRLLTTNLEVDGVTTLSGIINLNGDIEIGGNVTFENFIANTITAVSISTDSFVTDSITINSPIQSLEVGDLTVSGTLSTDDITSQTVNVLGNLNVVGALTNIFSEELNIADNIILLNSNLANTAQPNQSAGFTINRGAQPNVSFVWDEVQDIWNLDSRSLAANTFIGDLAGNASTATKLETPVTITLANTVIGSALFDGSENISIQTRIDVLYGGTY